MTKATLKITGLVQGVFYRDTAQEKAEELNLSGSVRNMPDGSVELIAYGEITNIEELIKWCYGGPPSAQVKDIDVTWDKITEKDPVPTAFEITY